MALSKALLILSLIIANSLGSLPSNPLPTQTLLETPRLPVLKRFIQQICPEHLCVSGTVLGAEHTTENRQKNFLQFTRQQEEK